MAFTNRIFDEKNLIVNEITFSNPLLERTGRELPLELIHPNEPLCDNRVKIGALGVGSRLQVLLRMFIENHGHNIELVCVCDEASSCLDACQKLFGRHLKTYSQTEEMLAKHPEIKWVLIGSMNHHHCAHVQACFAAGKHVFCEKPIAISISDCQLMLEAQKKAQRVFATGFVLRHAPLYERIYEIIQEGELGKIISIEQNEYLSPAHGGYIMRNWRRFEKFAGPHILEKCCHDVII